MLYFLTTLEHQNPALYYFGLLCGVAALGCLLLSWRTSTQVLGVNAWYKPFKFLLSSQVFVWTMAWYLRYLSDSQTAITAYSWGMIGLFTWENVYIGVQAARGQPSHFNVKSPLYTALYALMGIAAVSISIWTAYLGIRFFQQDLTQLPVAYKWGIRLGLIQFVLFSMEGMAMGARLQHTVGAEDGGPGLPVVNWSTRHGDLRIAHFVGMHALQIIPFASYYLSPSLWSTVLLALIYGLVATWLFVRALQGKPLLFSFRSVSQADLNRLARVEAK